MYISQKEFIKRTFQQRRLEQIRLHKKRLMKCIETIRKYTISGEQIDPAKIRLEIRLIMNDDNSNSNGSSSTSNITTTATDELEELYFFWNIAWWSTPYERSCGRRIRLLLWDVTHNAPFGLVNLQSPPLRLAALNRYLGLSERNGDSKMVTYWLNQSMYAQRIGALPPYNELLGSKMVALTLSAKEIREIYESKYGHNNKKKIIDDNHTTTAATAIPSRLLFITTTGIYGKSSVYERVKIKLRGRCWHVCKFLGYTSGYGTYHIPEELYRRAKELLALHNIDNRTGLQYGSSRKLRLLDRASKLLGLPDITYHGIKHGVYIFEHITNLHKVIHSNEEPHFTDFTFNELERYWKLRWCISRSERNSRWLRINSEDIVRRILEEMREC